MKKLLMAVAAFLPLCAGLMAQNVDNSAIFSVEDDQLMSALDSIVVSASRVDAKSPVAYSELDKRQIALQNPTSSLPMMLNLQPSVVAVNEGGTGLGYSKIRVRGADPSRTNVTLNGIAYNDAESQEVFWVNLPSLSGMLSSAQLQRGVGSSTNGVGAFGSSLNLVSALPAIKPYCEIELAGGSFFTGLGSVKAGTGRTKHGFSFDLGYNYNRTEGYIRNAYARLHSLMAVGSWYGDRSSAKIVYIAGRQRTGITWNGISAEEMAADRRYNSAGEYYDADGNMHYYDNETDNYIQHNVQGIYSINLAHNLYASATLHYTNGNGFYEQYKDDKKMSSFGLDADVISDVVRRTHLFNNLYAGSLNIKYETFRGLAQAGFNYSLYDGDHFGTLKWVDAMPDVDTKRHYYDNNGLKKDAAAFIKGALYLFDGSLNIYGDTQWRHIDYKMVGYDPDTGDLDHDFHYDFPNAKAGATLSLGRFSNLYASAALANKEPTRSDIKDAITTGDEIKPERLWDFEFGYRFNSSRLSFAVNAYLMEYQDQLVETGKISDSGYMIKKNIPDSYRRGIELSLGWKIIESLRLDANTTLSRNKIVADEGLLDLMLSPGYIGAYSLQWDAAKWLTLTLADKVVGRQYFDNTSNPDHMLDAYNVLNLGAVFSFGSFKVSAFVNNMLNSKYIADAWSYGDDCGYFPAAPINGLVKLSYRF